MRTAILLLTAAAAVLGQTNTITIRNTTASAQVNVPIQIGRPFLDNEIPEYPRVVCGGANLTTQADVKKRHPGGAVHFAIVSFLLPSIDANGSVTCNFINNTSGNNTPLSKSELLNASYNFDATMELTANCSGCTQGTQIYSARAALDGWDGASDSSVGPVWKWTSGGVAQTMILADHVNRAYDLGWKQVNGRPLASALSINPNTPSYSTITVASTAGIAMPSIVRISSVSNHDETSTAQSEDIRVCSATSTQLMVCAISSVTLVGTTVKVTTDVPHGIRDGQRVTLSEIRNSEGSFWNGVNGYWKVTVTGSNSFEFQSANIVAGDYGWGGIYGRGWNDSTVMGCAGSSTDINGNPSGCYVFPNEWADPPNPSYRGFRPIVHATFWPGINKVRVRFIGEAADAEKWGDLVYHLVLKTGSTAPSTRYSSIVDRGEQVFHRAGSRWTKEFWIGGDPPVMEIDHNLEYLKATRWSWNLDTDVNRNPSLAIPAIAIEEQAALWSNNLHDIYDFANMEKSQGSPAADDQDGPIPAWSTVYLRTMDHRLWPSVKGHGELGSSWYIHFRESTPGKKITRPASAGCLWACDADGNGRVLSITNRTGHFSRNVKLPGTLIPLDSRVQVMGSSTESATTTGGFRLGMIHVFEPFSVPYMLTGDLFFLEELWFWAGYGAAYSYAVNDTAPYARGPLNLGYGVSGVPASTCLKTPSTLTSDIAATTQLIPISTRWTGPAFPTYVSMPQPSTIGRGIEVVSNSAGDTQSVYLEGTSLAGETVNETVQLSGTAVVATVRTDWISLQGFRILNGPPSGVVTVRFAGGAGTLGVYPGPANPSAFMNHPLGDGLLVKSNDARDHVFSIKLYGTRIGQSSLTTETLTLNGVNPVPSSFSDWNRLYAVQTFRVGTSKPSLTYGTISVLRASDNYVVTTQSIAPPGPVPARIAPGTPDEERVRLLNVDVAARVAVVERGVGTTPKAHLSGDKFLFEVSDTNNWEIRITGWYLRLLAAAAFMSPDGSPEGSYFTSVARDQIASLEGQRNIPASASDPSYSAVWAWSNTVQRQVGDQGAESCGGVDLFSPLHMFDRGGPAFSQGWPVQDQAVIYGVDRSAAFESTGGFPANYVTMGLGRVEELGVAPATKILEWLAVFYNGVVASQVTEGCLNCPYTVLSSGRYPVTRTSDGGHVTTFTGLRELYDDGAYSGINWQGRTSFPVTSSYPCISGMAAAFVADKTGGAAAETWLSANLRSKMIWYSRPAAGAANTCNIRNSIVPRSVSAGSVSVITQTLPEGTEGIAYSAVLSALGGTQPYTWSISSGSCAGLTLSSAGLVSGAPTMAGTCSLTIQVTDGTTTASRPFEITIRPVAGSILNARAVAVSRSAAIGYGYRGLPAHTGCSLQVTRLGTTLYSATDDGGKAWRFSVATGLTPASTHTLGILCGSQSLSGAATQLATLASSSGTTDLLFRAKAPSRLEGASLLTLNYGPNAENLSQSVSSLCPDRCVLTLPAINRDSIYYLRWTWKTSTGTPLATSGTIATAVP